MAINNLMDLFILIVIPFILTPIFLPLSIFRQENEGGDEEEEEEKKKRERPPSSYGSMKSDEMEEEEEMKEELDQVFQLPFPVVVPESTTQQRTGYSLCL